MTSEVVLLNKEAIVIAADSAVTVGREPHPRYSKSANKIFDASAHGNLAVAIYSGADIDSVPWELAIKQFRRADSQHVEREKVTDYVPALFDFLRQNKLMFPLKQLDDLLKIKVGVAALKIVEDIQKIAPSISDPDIEIEARTAAWNAAFENERAICNSWNIVASLSVENY